MFVGNTKKRWYFFKHLNHTQGMMNESKEMSRVNRLAMVLPLLLDMRSVELKRENEDVKDGQHVW